jgi:hypothetical protein
VAQTSVAPAPQVDARLRAPALANDWPAWCQAWQTLDHGPLAEALARVRRGEGVRLTLCGERGWVAFESAAPGVLRRLRAFWSAPAASLTLEAL